MGFKSIKRKAKRSIKKVSKNTVAVKGIAKNTIALSKTALNNPAVQVAMMSNPYTGAAITAYKGYQTYKETKQQASAVRSSVQAVRRSGVEQSSEPVATVNRAVQRQQPSFPGWKQRLKSVRGF